MKIIALDLGFRSGFAAGVAGEKPRLAAWRLKRPADDLEVALRNLGCSLRDAIRDERPDLIVVERWMNPAASRNDLATIGQQQLHGGVETIAGCFGVPTVKPTTAQFRKHFCGVSTAAAPRKRGTERTMKQRAVDREATNRMVVERAILLGYLPRDSDDWDKANAAGLWDWACAVHGRRAPTHLHMFGEAAI